MRPEEAQLASHQKREDASTFHSTTLAVGWVSPDQGKVADEYLGPACVKVGTIIGFGCEGIGLPCVHLILCFQKDAKVLGDIS